MAGLQEAGHGSKDRCASRSAALAYYTAFSLAPILVIAVAVAGAVFDTDAATGAIVHQLQGLIGEPGATLVQHMLKSAHESGRELFATLAATATLVLGATTVAEIKDNLDQLWGRARKRSGGLWNLIRARVLSFGIVLVLAFLQLVSLVWSAGLSAAQSYLGRFSGLAGGRVAR